ncbi:hypothetical protein MMC24_001881 [Lignoscripta atroalba]|nr:hypothetical protein [Lignoscripta atroalba]
MVAVLHDKPARGKSSKPEAMTHQGLVVSDEIQMGLRETSPALSPSRKRKRSEKRLDEIEVDVAAPEPPSKKALRKAKKAKSAPAPATPKQNDGKLGSDIDEETDAKVAAPKRSEYSIWIGNLPWTASKADLRTFLMENTGITEDMVTRLHMPAPAEATIAASRQKIKPQNKGFAYVDFSTAAALAEALALSETLLTGRAVLIKDSKSFEGRPEKSKGDQESSVQTGKPPSKRVFVGNLAFDTTKEELQQHFARCGDVLDVHVATFEDSGKCKGYAWVEFLELEAGEAAIRGWVNMGTNQESGDEDEEAEVTEKATVTKKPKIRKWWVNRLKGRPLRMEFAEDKAVRYKKRFGKEGTAKKDVLNGDAPTVNTVEDGIVGNGVDTTTQSSSARPTPGYERKAKPGLDDRRGRKVDARTIKPGAALAGAQRLTGAIVESQGKKITFD